MELSENLKPGAQVLWAKALDLPGRFGHGQTGLNHFLFALLERHGAMAESLASGLNARDYVRQVEQHLRDGEIGDLVDPTALLDEVVQRARESGKAKASERDLAAVLLQRAGWTLLVTPQPAVSPRAPVRPAADEASPPGPGPAGAETETDYRPRARHPTPMLEEFGRDLCQEALAGELPTILGREMELQAVMETLCRWTKRNPLLIGPAGVGKTAVVEGLAQRVVRGEVPPPIQGIRIFALQASSLVSGASVVGKLEKRMHDILAEASQDGIILFIDEVHTIVGSGGMRQTSDVGSLLKPALAKGDIACIGATTDAEFHAFIERDRALERRFQPLRIQELSPDATLEILDVLRERAQRERQVTFTDRALQSIILLAQQYLRNRYFPDKAIDILEQCVAFALLNNLQEITPAVVSDVAERMVGVPVDLGAELSKRLGEVKERLVVEAFCPEAAADQLVGRLEIAMRGLDVEPGHPNAVLLVAGAPGELPELAAQVLATALYGGQQRLIEVDMTGFTHAEDVKWLTGAPPGYVGHDNPVQFHLELAQQPWSVILFKNVAASHPQAQELLAQAFRSGYFTTAQGRRVYLSDTIVVLTVTSESQTGRRIGFDVQDEEEMAEAPPPEARLETLVSPDLLSELDVWWRPRFPTPERVETWVKRWVLPALSRRYQQQGLEIDWDPSLLKWVSDAVIDAGDLKQGERLLEEQILPALIPYLNTPAKVILSYDEDGGVKVQSI
jgi:ATP-dependent Clp protease ATP-binding subunit ClpC